MKLNHLKLGQKVSLENKNLKFVFSGTVIEKDKALYVWNSKVNFGYKIDDNAAKMWDTVEVL